MFDQAEEQLSRDSDLDFVKFLEGLQNLRPLAESSNHDASDGAEGVSNQDAPRDGNLWNATGLRGSSQAIHKNAGTTETRPKRFRNPEVNRRAAKTFRERQKVFPVFLCSFLAEVVCRFATGPSAICTAAA